MVAGLTRRGLADDATSSQFGDDEVPLGGGIQVRGMGKLERQPRTSVA